jgi:uncharacterized protein YndB with AHSA1/START domain
VTASLFSLAVDVMLPASPQRVFEALIKPDRYSQWMGPEGSRTEVRRMDPVVGGRFEITVTLPNGFSVDIEGEYLTIDPPTRLSHTWLVDGDDIETTVSIELHQVDDMTQLVLVHDGFSDGADRDQNDGGWRHQLERLFALLEMEATTA